jgi:hypothetical protein
MEVAESERSGTQGGRKWGSLNQNLVEKIELSEMK